MSGQSGETTVGFGSGSGGGEQDCSQLRLDRPLDAPVAAVVATLSVGSVLSLSLQPGPPPVVALYDAAGALAGSVVATSRLLECLRQGVAFEAEVTQMPGGGSVRVEVRAVS